MAFFRRIFGGEKDKPPAGKSKSAADIQSSSAPASAKTVKPASSAPGGSGGSVVSVGTTKSGVPRLIRVPIPASTPPVSTGVAVRTDLSSTANTPSPDSSSSTTPSPQDTTPPESPSTVTTMATASTLPATTSTSRKPRRQVQFADFDRSLAEDKSGEEPVRFTRNGFKTEIEKYGYKLHGVNHDGNCFYYAFLDQLKMLQMHQVLH